MVATSSRFSLCLIVIAALTGCAVTKIDVDVYKGPLANHEEVQLEQMAVMAIGARPVLMRLRDRLEEAARQETISFGRQEPLRSVLDERYGRCIQEDEDTEKKEMEKAEKKRPIRFESDDARRVNAILCLYENRPPEYIGWLERRARKAVWQYRKAWRNFQGDNRDWKAFKDAMYPGLIPESPGSTPSSLPDGHPLEATCSKPKKKKKCYSTIDELIEAYGQLWAREGPERHAAKKIQNAHKEIFDLSPWAAPNHRLHSLMKSFTGKHRGSNWAYGLLSNDKLVQAHADLLFEAESNTKREFVHIATSIAQSFLSARSALRDLLRINLDILDAFGPRSDSESAQKLARRVLKAREISLLTGRINLQAFIKSVEGDPHWFSRELRKFADHAKDDGRVLSGGTPAFKEFLLFELAHNPLKTATALREAHRVFPYSSLPTDNYDTCTLKRYKFEERREFGLARASGQGGDEIQFNIEDVERLQEESGAAMSGLDRGRLNDGLESMIEDYLEQDDISKRHGKSDTSVETHRLRDALVRFAQKMLFVADYDNLISRDDPKTLLDYTKDYTIDLLTQPLSKDDKRIHEYTQVLQAVGNSILNQANELQARETHKKSLKESVGHARYGASQVSEDFDKPESPKIRTDDLETSREVLDRLIAVLEYERITAIKDGQDSDAGNLTNALRAAYESRTRLAFIRPASSYLRSSYPAASLQSDPGLTWRNELQRHSLKSIPVFGGTLTRYFDKSDISPAVLSQIDRQFWQNINTIRVGGAGRTNYVMVQDDIGNWYVKSYSADTEDITKSATTLGQFALSGRLGTDLVNRPEPSTGSAPARQLTALEAVFAKHQEEYSRATEETFKAVKAALNDLPSEVQTAWVKDPGTKEVRTEAEAQLSSVEVHLKETVTELNKDDPSKPEQVTQRPARIVEALHAMDHYRNQLEARLRENIPEEPPNGTNGTTEGRRTALNAVITDLNTVVKAKIGRFLKQREDTISAYENAIVFTGEVAGQAPGSTGETSAP